MDIQRWWCIHVTAMILSVLFSLEMLESMTDLTCVDSSFYAHILLFLIVGSEKNWKLNHR